MTQIAKRTTPLKTNLTAKPSASETNSASEINEPRNRPGNVADETQRSTQKSNVSPDAFVGKNGSAAEAVSSARQQNGDQGVAAGTTQDRLGGFRNTPIAAHAPVLNVVRNLAEVIGSKRVHWPSASLKDKPVEDASRAKEIVKASFGDQALQNEVGSLLENLGGVQSPDVWNLYFQSYDKIVFFSDGYLDLVHRADKALPKEGQFLDAGAGTGNFTSTLLGRSDKRTAIAVDISSVGLDTAWAKSDVLSAADRLRTKQGDLTSLSDHLAQMDEGTPLNGAVMNNVLYSLPPAERRDVLSQVFKSLEPGATFVLTDPRQETQLDVKRAEGFLADIAMDAVKNGSPMSEHDLALVAVMNHNLLIDGSPPFLTEKEMVSLAQDAGFELTAPPAETYYGQTLTLLLKKPPILGRGQVTE